MDEQELMSPYATKAIEYLIAVAYLLLFVPFWRFAQGTARARVAAEKRLLDWFHLPEGVFLHPGHAWARAEGAASVAVGLDDFGHKLVGPLDGLVLPRAGAPLRQGEKAFTLLADGTRIDVLSPVDGTVAEVNAKAASAAGTLYRDPYGTGWLLKVTPRRLSANLHDLLSGEAARRFLARAAESLRGSVSPALGALAQDGGTPVDGFARELDPVHWDDLVRSHFLTR